MVRDAKGVETIEGFEYLASVPIGEEIIQIVIFEEELFVSTNKHIYKLIDTRLDLVK